MILTNSGVLKLMQRIKSYIASQLNTKAPSVHTHTLSEIDDLSSLQMGGGYSKSEVDTLLNGKSDTSHTHTKSQITDFPSYGTTANTICEGNDSRLSDARTPTSHTHTKSEITDFPTLSTVATSGSYSDLSNKPSIPTNTNQLTNGAGYITSSGSCNYANSAGSSSIATRDSGGSWISGRDNAVVKQTRHSTEDGNSWNPAVSVKTKSGNWTIGTVGYDRLQFSYDTDEDYNTGNNRNTVVELNPESGTIITSANIGSQSVNYANSSGNADTVDGSHAWQMQTLASSGGSHGSNEWLMQCQYNVDGDGYFKLYCGDKSVGTKVDRATNAGYADSAGSVAWGNVSGRPTALSQFTNDSGFITTDGAAYPRRVGGVTMNFNWSGQGGQPTWLWGGEDGTNMYVYNPANFSVNYATNSGYTNWLRTSSHTDHLFHTEWDGSYFWTYVTAGDGGYRAVRVERSNSSGWADSAGSVAWGNVSGRPTALSQFTNDSGFLTSHQDLSGYIPKSGGAVITGGKLGRTVNNGEFLLCGGTDWSDGSFISLHGQNFNDGANETGIGAGSQRMRLYPSGTWTWSGTAVQLVSDQRYKQQIAEIDDKLLDAWEDVELSQFKYNDAVNEKGDNARLHTGYVVQQIDEACKKHNVDISKYGLYCHEEYAEETREVENEDGTKETKVIRPANEHYSLRYTEALIVECAFLRRENARLKERLSKIEKLLNI